jgi:uncharacterized protein
VTREKQRFFTIAITSLGRILLMRDRFLGRVGWSGDVSSHVGVSRHSIRSGKNRVDALLVKPESHPARASVLICHGIGETVQHWLPVQKILAANGITSLVFDYSGYGRSTGMFHTRQSEIDAVAAFRCLQRLTSPLPISVLGFSLGSGVATAIMPRVKAHRLLLCSAFTSLRSAAARFGIPRKFSSVIPAIWDAENALRDCSVPVLVVHGEKDRLFPVRMAKELIDFCSSSSELVVVPKLGHNEPFRRPHSSYWGMIIAQFILQDVSEGVPAA